MSGCSFTTYGIVRTNSIVLWIIDIRVLFSDVLNLLIKSELLIMCAHYNDTLHTVFQRNVLVMFVAVPTSNTIIIAFTTIEATRNVFDRPVLIDVPDVNKLRWAQ